MMYGLPTSTDVRKPIPKDAFFASKDVKGKDRSLFDSQVHSMTVRSIISPETVNLPKGEIPAIYVIDVQLNQPEISDSNLLLLNKIGHKNVYVLSYSGHSRLAVVEGIVFMTAAMPSEETSVRLEGLDLDQTWDGIVRSIVPDLRSDLSLKEAVAEHRRISSINDKIGSLKKKLGTSKQNHERHDIHRLIKELEKERDHPQPTDPWPLTNDFDKRGLFPQGGVSVMQRVKTVHQPPGGFINPKSMSETCFSDGLELRPENVSPQLMGTVVDYLSRFVLGDSREEAFHIPITGAKRLGRSDEMEGYMGRISGLDDESVINACRASSFDSYVRAGVPPKPDPSDILPDGATCENIRIMVGRVKRFLDEHGPVTQSCPDFVGGYTETVSRGDGDFLTRDTVWDLKVSKYPPTQEQTLQLAMYFLMGKHTPYPWFSTVTKIGIFNPRLNRAYIFDMLSLPKNVVKSIETDVIGYY